MDGSGWEFTVALEEAEPAHCRGRVTGRALVHERRTKISLYHSLLHPSDFRRLLAQATAMGVVSFVPVIADGSTIPQLGPGGNVAGEAEWPRLVRDAAEVAGRGRRPTIAGPKLFDHALDQASRSGTVLLLHTEGQPLPSTTVDRPFSIDLFCPPPGGFSTEERARAVARDVPIVALPATADGHDPIAPALATARALYAQLEPE
jgi:RsmE family RNA methyltransferase